MRVTVLVMGILATGITLWGTAGATGQVVPDSLAFGPVRTGTVVMDTVRVVNRGLIDLLVDSLRVSRDAFDLPAEPFTGSSVWLNPDDTLCVSVRFTPADTGVFSAALDLAFPTGSCRVPLIGEGVPEVVVINEVLADPPPGEQGDANGDGTRDSYQDEFVELLNIGFRAFDLSGCQLSDAGATQSKRFTFPPGTTIGPGSRAVLFGGGTPTDVPGLVFVDDGRIGGGLSNGGDGVYLIDPAGPDTLARAEYGSDGGADQSLVRSPEGRGGLVGHSLPPGKGAPMSPGRPRSMLSGIQVVPSADSISLGETITFSIAAIYTDGDTRPLTEGVTWSVGDTTIFRIQSDSGQARGVGTVVVSAHCGGLSSAEIPITVLPPPLASLLLAPQDTTVLVGESVNYASTGYYADGAEVEISGGLAWSTSDSTVATVEGGGRFRTVSAGSTTVSAALDGLVATGFLLSASGGDLNADAAHDVLDAIRLVHLILGFEGSPFEQRAADLNADGSIDIVDLAWLIRQILGNPIGEAKPAPVLAGRWWLERGILRVQTPGPLRAVSLAVHGGDVRVHPLGPRAWPVCMGANPEGLVQALVYSLEPDGLPSDLRIGLEGDVHAGGETHIAPGELPRIVEIGGVDLAGHRVELRHDKGPPEAFALHRVCPNPFNATAVLSYDLPSPARVLLRVYSLLGQEIGRLVDGSVDAGRHRIAWSGTDRSGRSVASGVYLACLEADGFRAVVPMVLVK